MVMTATHPGLLDIEVVHNIRTMSQCRVTEGGMFCSDLVRSATLGSLTERGIQQLREQGITTVVDLRSSQELEIRPTPDLSAAGIRVVHAPVVEYDASPLEPRNFQGYAVRYRELLDLGRDAYRTFFETAATAEGRVLFHCSAGKDRTGIAAALLLSLAGVSDDEIIEDYARSAELLEPLWDTWKPRFDEEGIDEDLARRMMGSERQDMADTLAYIRSRWGSAEGYLIDIGVDDETRRTLVTRLTGRA